MNIDAYTRIVLTVIAGCLVYFVAKDLTLVPDARAELDAPAITPVNIVQIAGSPVPPVEKEAVNAVATLPVRVF